MTNEYESVEYVIERLNTGSQLTLSCLLSRQWTDWQAHLEYVCETEYPGWKVVTTIETPDK